MPDYIDPLRDGPRNDTMQRLYDKYVQICRENGLSAREKILRDLALLDAAHVMPGKDRIAAYIVAKSHVIAAGVLQSHEFRPLERWWVNSAPERDTYRMRVKLEDAGALAYQRAIKDGSAY